MKKCLFVILSALLVLFCLSAVVCAEDNTDWKGLTVDDIRSDDVAFMDGDTYVFIGKQNAYGDELKATIWVNGATLHQQFIDTYAIKSWKIADESVIRGEEFLDSDGHINVDVFPVGPGETTITLYPDGDAPSKALTFRVEPASFSVTCDQYVLEEGVEGPYLNLLSIDEEVFFRTPDNQHYTDIIKVSSSNPDVADVRIVKQDEGNNYVSLTPKGTGETTIVFVGDFGATCQVRVVVDYPELILNIGNKTSLKFDSYKGDAGLEDPICAEYYDENHLVKAVSSNTSVVKTKKVKTGYYDLIPVAKGTANVTFTDVYGNTKTIKVTVTQKYIDERKYLAKLDFDLFSDSCLYGEKIYGRSRFSKAEAYILVNGTKYKIKRLNAKGEFLVKIPMVKIGTKVTFVAKYKQAKLTTTHKIVSNKPPIKIYKVKHTDTKIKGYVKNIHKGDKVIIKVGTKTYTKKVTKTKDKFSFTQKIKKQKKNSKIKITVKNKYNQKLKSKTITVQ